MMVFFQIRQSEIQMNQQTFRVAILFHSLFSFQMCARGRRSSLVSPLYARLCETILCLRLVFIW